MNFSLSICLLVLSTCLIAFGQTTDGAIIKGDYLETPQAEDEEPGNEVQNLQEQDLAGESGLVEGSSSLQEDQEGDEEKLGMDLEDFLNQFVLIKTPHGIILGRASPSSEMSRVRRAKQQAEKNFQLRVRKADRSPYNTNFQLRVRKNGQAQQYSNLPNFGANTSGLNSGRVRKAIAQEIRDRRRMAADHSNNNFQLRVRKSQERRTRSSAGKNFQLRVRRSAEW